MDRVRNILLAEDNPADIRLFTLTAKETFKNAHVDAVRDGQEVMDYLRRRNGYESKPMPEMLILDINMPRMDGFEVMRAIRVDHRLSHLPIVIFSCASSHDQINKAYDCGASCFVSKPNDLHEYERVCGEIGRFWLEVATVPRLSTAAAA